MMIPKNAAPAAIQRKSLGLGFIDAFKTALATKGDKEKSAGVKIHFFALFVILCGYSFLDRS
jgi:hypothetical protein